MPKSPSLEPVHGNGAKRNGMLLSDSAGDPNAAEQRLAKAIETWPSAELPDDLKRAIGRLVQTHHRNVD